MSISQTFADWQSLQTWLDNRGMFHVELGLARMDKALDCLDLSTPPFPVCQVLGTNGKGSVCSFLSSLFQASGFECGLYTSPHFLSPKERIVINGKMTTEEDWLKASNELVSRYPAWNNLTYFEFITLLAMIIFRNKKINIAILEAGLGGKNDATTAIMAKWQCFTPIAMDHVAVIGPTFKDIAKDKAAAIQPCANVFSESQFPGAATILKKETLAKKATLQFCAPFKLPSDCKPLLSAPFQDQNMGVAIGCAQTVWSDLKHPGLSREGIINALTSAFLPGRWQKIPQCKDHPPVILDGGHNPHAIKALADNLAEKPYSVIFSCMADKNWQTAAQILVKAFPDAFFLVPDLPTPRAEKSKTISDWLNKIAPGKAYSFAGEQGVKKSLDFANAEFPNKPCLVCGSFFLLAEIYGLFPEYLNHELSLP